VPSDLKEKVEKLKKESHQQGGSEVARILRKKSGGITGQTKICGQNHEESGKKLGEREKRKKKAQKKMGKVGSTRPCTSTERCKGVFRGHTKLYWGSGDVTRERRGSLRLLREGGQSAGGNKPVVIEWGFTLYSRG